VSPMHWNSFSDPQSVLVRVAPETHASTVRVLQRGTPRPERAPPYAPSALGVTTVSPITSTSHKRQPLDTYSSIAPAPAPRASLPCRKIHRPPWDLQLLEFAGGSAKVRRICRVGGPAGFSPACAAAVAVLQQWLVAGETSRSGGRQSSCREGSGRAA
jgi:hypothetical protein